MAIRILPPNGHDGQLSVSVKDDGVGLHPAAVRGRGLGLIGMQERVMELGGELKLTSQLVAKILIDQEAAHDGGSDSTG